MSSLAVKPAPWASQRRKARVGDESLARRVSKGDPEAFALIYERYHQPLYRLCRSLLRDDTDAQDALQSTFEKAFVALGQGRRGAPLRPWLFCIAHNEAINAIRARGRGMSDPAQIASAVDSPHERVEERDRLARLIEDLADLPDRLRSALVMRELEDLSHSEIASALGISTASAKQAIFEARCALQDAAEGRAMACDAIRRTISDGDGRALRARRVRAHLRVCAGCAEFAAAIDGRRSALRALAPGLPAAAAATIFARASATVSAPAGGAGAGTGVGAAGGVLGKGFATAVLSSKLTTGAAILATAVAGTGSVAVVAHLAHPASRVRHHPARPRAGSARPTAPRAGSARPTAPRAALAAGGSLRVTHSRTVARSGAGLDVGAPGRAVGLAGAPGQVGAHPRTTGSQGLHRARGHGGAAHGGWAGIGAAASTRSAAGVAKGHAQIHRALGRGRGRTSAPGQTGATAVHGGNGRGPHK